MPGLHSTWPRSTSSRLVPRSSMPTLSPAWPWSSSLRNISTPVQVVFCVGVMPTISISSPTLTTPRSTRPVTTVPRPEIENTSSTGIRNGAVDRALGRAGCSCRARRPASGSTPSPSSPLSPSSASLAEPWMIGVSSPGNSYLSSSSRTSISTSSSSSASSTMSHLFRYTMMYGTPTWRASRMCSRVCGIGPSAAEHHQDRAVHLRRTGDHVLDVVGVPRAVDVRVVAVLRSRTRRARC